MNIQSETRPFTTRNDGQFGVDWILAPTGGKEFWSDYWERRPLVIRRSDPAYYRSLLSLADVDQILSTSAIRENDIRIIKHGQHTSVSGLRAASLPGTSNRLEGLYEQYRAGATIVIQALHERWAPLRRLCRNVARAVSGGAQANVYLTPAGETGLLPHYDTHDVMVLQASGSKNWRIFGRAISAPTRGQPYKRTAETQKATLEFAMRAGDFLYLPRGYMHVAEARDETSLHVTVGIHPITVADVIRGTIETAIERQAAFRKALAPNFVDDAQSRRRSVRRVRNAFAAILKAVDAVAAVQDAAKWAMVAEPPSLDGHLIDLSALPYLSLRSRLRIRPDLAWRSSKTDEHVLLTFNGKHVRLPHFVQPCLEHITSEDGFVVGNMPDVIDDEGKLVLAARLLREGFLTTAY